MKARLYTRVSHEEQVKYGVSLDAQLQALQDYCAAKDINIVKAYTDEGISAKDVKHRYGLQSLIRECEKGDMILFTKLDRFSRNVLDANILVKELDEKGVSIKAINEDDIDTSTADGRFLFNLKLSLAERELGKTSERIKDVFTYKIKTGYIVTGSIPYGYKIVNKRLVIDENEASKIKQLFDKYERCQSLNEVTRWWNSENEHITVSLYSIRKKLTNMLYIGKHPSGLNDRYCEPIISEAQFRNVGKILETNIPRTKGNHVHLFTRLIVCPDCMNKMVANIRAGGKSTFYHCATSKIAKNCTNKMCISELKVEKYLLTELSKICSETYDLEFRNQKSHGEKNGLKVKDLEGKIERLKELYIDGLVDKGTFDRKYKLLNDQLKEELANIMPEAKTEVTELLGVNIVELYNMLNRENRRNFWRKYVDKIVLNKDRTIAITWK